MMSDAQLELRGLAHVISFTADGRELHQAIHCFYQAERWDLLAEVLRLARLFSEARAVWQIHEIGQVHVRSELLVPDFFDWFCQAMIWFDLYTDAATETCSMDQENATFIRSMVMSNVADPSLFWAETLERFRSSGFPQERIDLLERLSKDEELMTVLPPSSRDSVDARFRTFCQINQKHILKQLQVGTQGVDLSCHVYLVLDSDGLVKVFKEIVPRDDQRLRFGFNTELEIYTACGAENGSLPRCYGISQIDENLQFMRLSFCFGQSLSDYIHTGQMLSVNEACHVIQRLATTLADLHDCGVLYLDLKPENVKLNGVEVQLFDFNASRLVRDPHQIVTSLPFDPRYVPPETSLHLRASAASDVFQLGIVFHELLTGEHPFASSSSLEQGSGKRIQAFLTYSLPNALLPYSGGLAHERQDDRLHVIERMLNKDPTQRPTMRQVAEALTGPVVQRIAHRRRSQHPDREKNTVLFPARMGIPHCGHIEFIARIMELGYYVIISLQKSYVITDDDPLPKWQVMKMVAQSLEDKGFGSKDFEFLFTPYYETDAQHRLHFAMMPGAEDVVAVASSNPSVHELFEHLPIIDQRVTFGTEGEIYDDRSWGKILRGAVLSQDRSTFDAFIASGAERILSFDEMRQAYAASSVEFVRGQVFVVLQDRAQQQIVSGRVRRYVSPEESLVRLLRDRGMSAEILHPYARDTFVEINGHFGTFRYERMSLDVNGNEHIYFTWIPTSPNPSD